MKIILIFLVLLSFIIIFFTDAKTIFPPQGMSHKDLIKIIQEKKAQQKVEFAFDLHKVLVHKDFKTQMKLVWNYPHKFKFIKSLTDIALLSDLTAMTGQFFINLWPGYTPYFNEVTSNKLITSFQKANKQDLAEFITEIVNTQIVDQDLKKMIIELKRKGYKIRLASNIGTQTFQKLKQSLEKNEEDLFTYFDKDVTGNEGKTVDYTISTAQKPNSVYYKEFLETYNERGDILIFFIDDKLANVVQASKQGMVGIRFKNTQQLRNDLELLGIL